MCPRRHQPNSPNRPSRPNHESPAARRVIGRFAVGLAVDGLLEDDGRRSTPYHLSARRSHPDVRHRRRPCDAWPLRAAPRHLRRLHSERARAVVHRRFHPLSGSAGLREHPHRELRNRPPDHAYARRGTAYHPRCARRRRPKQCHLLRGGIDRRDRQTSGYPWPADPCPIGRSLPPEFPHSERGASGRFHRSVRAPLQRAALA